MGLSFRESNSWEFPEDLVIEILLRLPAKSLMRFKCVSKLWSSLISSSYFSNRFLTLPTPRLYICLVDRSNYHNSVIMSLAQDNTTLSSFIVDHDLTIPHRGGPIFQSLCGFMCYNIGKRLQIYNPATRQLVTLPDIKSDIIPPPNLLRHQIIFYFFGHDPVSNQYKVLCSISPHLGRIPEHWVFSLKQPGGGSWRKLAPPNLCPYVPHKRGLSINGLVYYLAWIDSRNFVLVSFHISSEEFKLIQLPYSDGDKLSKRLRNVCLIEYCGKAALFDSTHLQDKGIVDLWVLEDALKKEWSSKTLVLPSTQLHLVNNYILRKQHATQNGKLLLLPRHLVSPFHILCYDLQSNDMRKIEIKGIPDYWFSKDKCYDAMFLDQSDSIISLET